MAPTVTSLNVGPAVSTVVFNALLTGVCAMQYAQYYSAGYKDRWFIRFLVPWCIFVDALQFGSAYSMLWDYTVTNYGNPRSDLLAPFGFLATPIITCLSSAPIQIFLGYRIKILSKSWIWFCIISIAALVQAGFGFACTACFVAQPDATHFGVCLPVASGWLGVAVADDVLITLLLFIYLRGSRTGFSGTNSLISRLIRRSVETAIFVTTFCIVDLLSFALLPGTGVHLFWQFPIGRIYANTLMLTLNSRKRDASGDPSYGDDTESGGRRHHSIPNSRGAAGTEVNISVQREIQMDSFPTNDVESRHSVGSDRKDVPFVPDVPSYNNTKGGDAY